MKISVAMATYNGADFITEQLQSILNQTKQVDEVIICDDRSKDNTVEVIEKFVADNNCADKIKIWVNEKNLGYASNFIKTLRKTTGDYVFFCDQDDIWIENRVEKMLEKMEENPSIMLLGSEFTSFSSSSDAPSVPKWEQKMYTNDQSIERLAFSPENIFIGAQGCTMCMRKDFLNRIDKYWYEGWAHDEYVWKLALCLDGLYMYHSYTLKRRLHSNNVTMRKMRDVKKRIIFLEELLKSHKQTYQFAKDIGLSKDKLKLLERNIKAANLRIELLRDKKYFNTIKLLFGYFNCYHKSRSILVELKMAIKE